MIFSQRIIKMDFIHKFNELFNLIKEKKEKNTT